MALSDLHHTRQVERVAEGVRHEDGLRPGPDGLFDRLDIGVVGSEIDVNEHGNQPVLDDWVDRCWEPDGRRDHLITGHKPPVLEPR